MSTLQLRTFSSYSALTHQPMSAILTRGLRQFGCTRPGRSSTSSKNSQHPFASQTAGTSSYSRLTHLTPSGAARMVDVGQKAATHRVATAVGTVRFSNPEPVSLIKDNKIKKGDVLAVARIAGIMAAKKTSEIVPLCHPIAISKVNVDLAVWDQPDQPEKGNQATNRKKLDAELRHFGQVNIEVSVECVGPTGVEMEALMAVNGAALTVYDMCKAVDKHMRIEGIRVVRKEGGRSGDWREQEWKSLNAD